jgi:hypothetical protein
MSPVPVNVPLDCAEIFPGHRPIIRTATQMHTDGLLTVIVASSSFPGLQG